MLNVKEAKIVGNTKKMMPPSVKRDFIGGHALSFRRRTTEFMSDLAKIGDVTHFFVGKQIAYFINTPELIRDVFVTNHQKFHKGLGLQKMKRLLGEGLLTSEEDFHLRQRRMIQPAFHRQRIANYAASMVEFGEKLGNEWKDGEMREISAEMMRLTLYIVSKTLFNANVESEAAEIAESIDKMLSGFNLMMMLPSITLLEKMPFSPFKGYHLAQEKIDSIIYKIINERRKTGNDAGDLLSMLLLAQDEDDGGKMTDKQVRDEALTLFLAGHETTANALVWTWYLLSQNPEAEKKFHEEIDRIFPNKELPKFEDYPKLRYTEAVLAESMRLFPPAWIVGRTALTEYKIGDYKLEKDDLIFASPYVMHRDRRFWTNADKFQPERWLTENAVKEASQKFTYFPFGGGVRRCIGEQFAWTEGVLLLATLARKWKLRLSPEQKIVLRPLVTLRSKFGMKMRVEKR